MAKGYLVANVSVTDAAGYQEYRSQVQAVVEQHGGRFLVRGGAIERKENAGGLDRVVVLEFPSMERARAFYDSAAYAPLLALRGRTARSDVVLVEGV